MVWCGVVWCGVVGCGAVWCGVVWCGVVWCGVVWCACSPNSPRMSTWHRPREQGLPSERWPRGRAARRWGMVTPSRFSPSRGPLRLSVRRHDVYAHMCLYIFTTSARSRLSAVPRAETPIKSKRHFYAVLYSSARHSRWECAEMRRVDALQHRTTLARSQLTSLSPPDADKLPLDSSRRSRTPASRGTPL